MKVKVIYTGGIVENGKFYKKGEVFETTPERAKALGDTIDIIEKAKLTEESEQREEVTKQVEKPPKDKMIHKAKRK